MEIYKNDYTKEDDPMLWELHEIRHELAQQHQTPEQMNATARQIIAQYHLLHLKIVHPNVPQRVIQQQPSHADVSKNVPIEQGA